jgi:energy-coupling factor transporter ATP-binding protein EcfA2
MIATFQKATKKQSRLRMALDGPSGSGKTFTALTFATALAAHRGGRVAVIDTERGSASKYADMFDFDVLELGAYAPQQYVDGIKAAEQAGYAVVVVDSLSHAWEGEGGVLEMHDKAVARQRGGNSWTAWRDVTPQHQALVNAMLQSRCDVIATMRSKMEYLQTDGDNGKATIKKVGMAPIQRAGMEYEFDIVADIDVDHRLVVSKSRCFTVADAVATKPDGAWMAPVIAWLSDGASAVEPVAESQGPQPAAAPTAIAPAPSGAKQAPTNSTAKPQPVAVGKNWTDDTRLANKFMAKAIDALGITGQQVYEALGVTQISEWRYSMDDAKAQIQQWIDQQQARDEPDPEDEQEDDAAPYDDNGLADQPEIVQAEPLF